MARPLPSAHRGAQRALLALVTASAALAVGAATASADNAAVDLRSIRTSPVALPVDNGVPLSGLTGPLTQTGSVGAVPTLEQLGALLGGGGGAVA